MVKLKLFVIYIQIFRCLPQHINLPVPKVPVPKEPHITTIFQHYATGNPMQMGETRLVSVQPNVYPACVHWTLTKIGTQDQVIILEPYS